MFEQPTGHPVSGRLGWFAHAFSDAPTPQAVALKTAIMAWAQHHLFEFDWILDAALNTLDFWDRRATMEGQEAPGTVAPRQLLMPAPDVRNRAEFENNFVYRAPFSHEEGEPASAYRKRLTKDIQKAVNRHMGTITTSAYQLHPATLGRDIGWLAEYHRGRRAFDIALEAGIDQRSVTRAITDLGKLIGIPIKRGRTPKKGRRK